MKPYDLVLSKLSVVSSNCTTAKALCPAHADETPSLSVTEGDDGKVLLTCHAGCPPLAICHAIGLKLSDLFPPRRGNGSKVLVAVYDYCDESGKLIFQKCRFRPKSFSLRRPDGKGGWIWDLKDVAKKPLYRLPELLAASHTRNVFIVEGEKDADRLAELGLVATTNFDGASGWDPDHDLHFDDRRVVILPDNDEPGRLKANRLVDALVYRATSVKVVELPGLPDHGDVCDWLDAGHDKVDLLELVNDTPAHEKPEKPFRANRSLLAEDQRTDAANAKRLVEKFPGVIHWCQPWGKWLVWKGTHWREDDVREVDAMAKAVGADLTAELKKVENMHLDKEELRPIKSFVKLSNSAAGVNNMISLARSEPGIAILPNVLDTDPWLLNVQNGTLDLQTGELRKHRREDYISKLCPVRFDKDAKCPRWLKFLKRIIPNVETARYLRRLLGFSLTARTEDHILPFLYGTGANGKSTFIDTFIKLLGPDYAMSGAPKMLLSKNYDAHPTEIADLFGKRFVSCEETDKGSRLNEGLIKYLTGGNQIKARRMREDPWDFDPTHKLWIAANHRPNIQGTDYGIWRRVKLIPFTVKILAGEDNKKLKDQLLEELPGILNWCVGGCLEWQKNGLGEPQDVLDATKEYKQDVDILGQFIEARCVLGPNHKIDFKRLFEAYGAWCDDEKLKTMNRTAFGIALKERDMAKKKTTNAIMILGIDLHGD